MEPKRMKRFRDAGLIGCLNDSGVTSCNYKESIILSDEDRDQFLYHLENPPSPNQKLREAIDKYVRQNSLNNPKSDEIDGLYN